TFQDLAAIRDVDEGRTPELLDQLVPVLVELGILSAGRPQGPLLPPEGPGTLSVEPLVRREDEAPSGHQHAPHLPQGGDPEGEARNGHQAVEGEEASVEGSGRERKSAGIPDAERDSLTSPFRMPPG